MVQSAAIMAFQSSRKCKPTKYESSSLGSWISWLSITEVMNRVKCNTTWILTSREAAACFLIDFLLRGKAIVFLEFFPCCYWLERVRKKNNVLTIKDLGVLTYTWIVHIMALTHHSDCRSLDRFRHGRFNVCNRLKRTQTSWKRSLTALTTADRIAHIE